MTGMLKKNLRLVVQLAWTALTNGYVRGWSSGKIFAGKTKLMCVPGLNCYSCPGALFSCPLGALQATLNSQEYRFAFYALGLIMAFGTILGRFVCGWLCPFGLVQDLLYKIPFFKKVQKLPGEKYLRYIRYVVLSVLVILLPIVALGSFGEGIPWYCKWLCPAGTLQAGIPLVIQNEGLRSLAGGLYAHKVAILLLILFTAVPLYRPFCRYLCPLGALYGLFNPISATRFSVDENKCDKCKACQKACKFDIPVYEKPNSTDCIRCTECLKACPTGALRYANSTKNAKKQLKSCTKQ